MIGKIIYFGDYDAFVDGVKYHAERIKSKVERRIFLENGLKFVYSNLGLDLENRNDMLLYLDEKINEIEQGLG